MIMIQTMESNHSNSNINLELPPVQNLNTKPDESSNLPTFGKENMIRNMLKRNNSEAHKIGMKKG